MKYEEPSMSIEFLEPVYTLNVSGESGGNGTIIQSLDETTDGTLQ